MKKILRYALLSAMTLVCTTAWAAEVEFKNGNRIGATDNSSAWYADNSKTIEIGHHQTLTLKFKTYTATDAELTAAGVTDPWSDQWTHALNIWDGQDQNFYFKGCGWGWKTHGGTVNDPADYNVNDAVAYYGKTYDWAAGYRTMIGTGADVVMTIARYGSELRIAQEFTTSGGAKYYHYFVGPFGLEDGSVWLQVTTERAHIDITEDYSLTDSQLTTGTLIGQFSNNGNFLTGNHEDFTLKANETLNLHFKNYSNKLANANNWFLEIVNNGKYLDLQADRAGWDYNANGEYYNVANWTLSPSATYWDNYIDFMDGADVNMTIARSGNTLTITAVQTSTASVVRTATYTLIHADFASNDITVKLSSMYSHLDLLPVTKTIDANNGWATLSSEYALDFSGDIANLEKAYAITGNNETTLTLSEISQVVAASEGVLLKGSGECKIPIKASGTAVSGNKLKANLAETVKDANSIYVLMDGTNGVGFYKNNNDFTVGANTAYLNATDISGARVFYGFDNDATGIENIKNDAFTFGNFYDLQGRQVAQPKKGLYIMNGKKVVLK